MKQFNPDIQKENDVCGHECEDTMKILITGECEDCPANTRILSREKNECEAFTCDDNQVLSHGANAYYCKDCPLYHRTSAETQECYKDACMGRKIISPSGYCKDCPPY